MNLNGKQICELFNLKMNLNGKQSYELFNLKMNLNGKIGELFSLKFNFNLYFPLIMKSHENGGSLNIQKTLGVVRIYILDFYP